MVRRHEAAAQQGLLVFTVEEKRPHQQILNGLNSGFTSEQRHARPRRSAARSVATRAV